jgi:Uma2 family endonuclease
MRAVSANAASARICEEEPPYRPEDELAPRPDISHLITENDEPVDNLHSERNMRLLADSVQYSYQPGCSFVAMANVGLFYQANSPAVVPDFLLSLDVKLPQPAPGEFLNKEYRSYFIWEYGKSPDLVVEFVSNKEGGELTRKLKLCAHARVSYYAVYDAERRIQPDAISCYVLTGGEYQRLQENRIERLGLQLIEWEGVYQDFPARYVRLTDLKGNLLRHGGEVIEQGREDLAAAKQLAETERQRAETLAARLRELGVEP